MPIGQIWFAAGLVAGGCVCVFLYVSLQILKARVRAQTKRLDAALRAHDRLRGALAQQHALAGLTRAGLTPRLEFALHSQHGEDAFLLALFPDQHDGFFIEAGAYDGHTLSVSWVFEAMGWTGLLVEPLPERARACVAHRPHSRVEHCALMRDNSRTTVELTVPVDAQGAGMLSSIAPGRAQRRRLRRASSTVSRITVPANSLTHLLEIQSPPKAIDFLVLDVEGHELEALAGLDFLRFRPAVMLIEVNSARSDAELLPILARLNYRTPGLLAVNRIAIAAERTDLWDRAVRYLA
ncbi:hypothetical protein BH11PLA1_BH11PLA1_03840 [soil metagenome]